MDGKIKKVAITPTAFDEEGAIKKETFATITLEVPMDSSGQREGIFDIQNALDTEWHNIEIVPKQLTAETVKVEIAKRNGQQKMEDVANNE